MKKGLIILAALVAVIIAGYYAVKADDSKTAESLGNQFSTYSQSDVGLQFDYRTGPEGYVLEERMPVDIGEQPVKIIILTRTEDAQKEPPAYGEGPPVITVAVFDNAKNQFSRAWAEENTQYSNFNLKTSDAREAVIGGANAIRYMADGLYASENAVVAHGDRVYVITGQFIDADSDIRRDFEPLIQSIRFIPEPGQE